MFGKGKLEKVVWKGKVVFEGRYWPESEKSCEAHELAMVSAMRRAGMTEDEIEQYFIDQYMSR